MMDYDGNSTNLLLIILAVRLQRVVRGLQPGKRSAERITPRSLAETYFDHGLSPSLDAANKRARRHLEIMDEVFGLEGSSRSGYAMRRRFPTFRDMFEYWRASISPPNPNDRRLHVMLTGLIEAIDNAFTNDPIVVPRLARTLKQRYGNKNIRDTARPLEELFANQHIAHWLELIESDDDEMRVDTLADPLLLRLRPRREVSDNADISIMLAMPGRIRPALQRVLDGLEPVQQRELEKVADDVRRSRVWLIEGQRWLPWLLFQEGELGPVLLTLRNLEDAHFMDLQVDHLVYRRTDEHFVPYPFDSATWQYFTQMAG